MSRPVFAVYRHISVAVAAMGSRSLPKETAIAIDNDQRQQPIGD
jgi:hypothetical protein